MALTFAGVLPNDRAANLAVYAVLWAVLIGWQVVTARSARLPSFGAVVRLARGWWITRWSLLFGWAWLGWHIFVRTNY